MPSGTDSAPLAQFRATAKGKPKQVYLEIAEDYQGEKDEGIKEKLGKEIN